MQSSKNLSIQGLRSKIITTKDNLITLLISSLKDVQIQNKDIVIITSKVVAITQGRIAKITKPGDFEKLVKSEADGVIGQLPYPSGRCSAGGESKTPRNSAESNSRNAVTLTLKNNIFIPWAGIDRSNIKKGYVVLWPNEPYKAADQICKALKKAYKLKQLGVIISDSICTPLRRGVSAVALGYAGFRGVNDLRGKKDLFGNKLKVTQQGMADMLAVSAHLVMGESNESTPFAIIKNPPDSVVFTDSKINPKESVISPQDCLFSSLYVSRSRKFTK